jgi:hypothetical protein
MLWKKKDKAASPRLTCQVDECNFSCGDYLLLQKHTYKNHPGLKLQCEIEGCNFTCSDYMTLGKHTSWKHPQEVV